MRRVENDIVRAHLRQTEIPLFRRCGEKSRRKERRMASCCWPSSRWKENRERVSEREGERVREIGDVDSMGVKGSQPRNAGPQNTNNVSLCSPLDSQRVDGSAGDLEEERPISWYGCFRSFFFFFSFIFPNNPREDGWSNKSESSSRSPRRGPV